MKLRYIMLFIVFIVGLTSCKKDKYPIVGKWQQVKLHTYTKSYSGVISNDTTYLRPSFNSSNYAQFNNDGTCIIGLFYPPGPYEYTALVANIATQKYNYIPAGNKYVLTIPTTLINPGGFGEADTASMSGNTVLIHHVFDSHINYSISDDYYTR